MQGRDLVQIRTLAEFQQDPDFLPPSGAILKPNRRSIQNTKH